MKYRSFFWLLLLPIIFFLYVFYKTELISKDLTGPILRSIPVRTTPEKQKVLSPVQVLLWNDGLEDNWMGFGSTPLLKTPNWLGHEVQKKKCPVQCTFTEDKSQVGSSNAVLFEGRPKDPNKIWDWLRTPIELPQKRAGQLWVNFGMYHPMNYPLLAQQGYVQHFDINMTFAQDSDVPISLYCMWGGVNNTLLRAPPKKSSEKLVAFYSNNCMNGNGARKRTEYVRQLMEHISVDSFGECLHTKDLPSDMLALRTSDYGQFMKKLIEIISEYKFFLAFESAIGTDYVTEKLMLAYLARTVPVYMGAPNVEDWAPGLNSLIPVDDFESPQELAAFLSALNKDEQKYRRYFDWKIAQQFPPKFAQKMNNCVFYNSECRLCMKIAEMQSENPQNASTLANNNFALQMDGQTWVEIPSHPTLHLKDVFTLMAWIYLDEMVDYRIIDKATEGKVDGYSMDVLKKGNRGFLRLCVAGGCYMGMKPLSVGNWYHVAVVYFNARVAYKNKMEYSGIKFYVNGEFDHWQQFPVLMYGISSVQQNDLPLRLGRAGSGNAFFKGKLDDISVWSELLSEEQIRRYMFQRLSGDEKGLVAYWSFNEGRGDIAYDLSKGKRHGRIHGNVQWIAAEEKELILNSCL